jgi:hypothetical protein
MPIHSTGRIFQTTNSHLEVRETPVDRNHSFHMRLPFSIFVGYLSAAALNQPLARMVAGAEGDLSMLTVVQLKDKLRTAGLPVSGRKAELIERLSATACPADAASVSEGRAFPLIGIEACTQ